MINGCNAMALSLVSASFDTFCKSKRLAKEFQLKIIFNVVIVPGERENWVVGGGVETEEYREKHHHKKRSGVHPRKK